MVRSRLTLAERWTDCSRCERHHTRLAVYAPVWPLEVQVVVVGVVASRATQAAQTPSPDLLVVVEHFQSSLKLSDKECLADHLAACGLGAQLTADEVAACAQRFVQHAMRGACPKVIVLFGRRALGLAIQAGLVDDTGSTWKPAGTIMSATVVFIEDLLGLTKGVKRIAKLLNTHVVSTVKENRSLLVAKAGDLLRMLGDHAGRGECKPGSSTWVRWKRRRLDERLVARHLAGRRYAAPFHPKGAWPFVVLDIDRHNAVQESVFEETLKTLQKLLPKSLAVQSSPSGGVHLYVLLPPGMAYADGALTLRAFITLRGLRWHDAGPSNRRVRTEIVEAPDQPVRLPFGFGSYLLGSSKPLHEQLDEFVAFIGSHDNRDFNGAQRYVSKKLKPKGASLGTRRKGLQKSLLEEEVRGLPRVRLEETDPWTKVLPKLPAPLRILGAGGIPAYGTRHRWTYALARELADLVPPDEVRSLMAYWLRNRAHISEGIETDPIAVEHQAVEIIDGIYRKLRGVPEMYWTTIEAAITLDYRVFSRPVRPGTLAHAELLDRFRPRHKEIDLQRKRRINWRIDFSLADALETAFFIARRFFELGRPERAVGHGEFARLVGKNEARRMRMVVVGSQSWLLQTDGYERERHARIYKLALWPPRPGPRLFCPPR